MRRARGSAGSASIWVVAAAALLMAVAGAAVVRAAAVLARHRVEAAADLAALAGAGRLGTGEDPCAASARAARWNGAELVVCRVRSDPTGRTGVVDVAVVRRVGLPWLGRPTVRASARAGRAPPGRDVRPDQLTTHLPPRRVWHADSRLPEDGAAPAKQAGDEKQEGERVEVSVSRNAAEDIPVVAVSGEVDVYSAPELKESLTKLLQSGATSVVVDLSDVAFLDSTGLGALVEARAATSETGGSLPIVCGHERILKLFTITGLDGVFSIHKTVEEALAGLQA